MSGTPANASVWADADVYIAAVGATLPADASTPFNGEWTLVGLLDGGDGFEESRSEDKKDHFAWGGILVETTRKNFKLVKKFSVLEDSVATRTLIWPGSSASEVIVPVPADIFIAFETRSGGKVKRLITRERAQVDLSGAVKDGEEDLTKYTLEATIFPSSGGVLFDRQATPEIASIAITPLTLALAVAAVKPLTATATYTDASTGDVTDTVKWTSATPAKATVEFGYVTGVSAGTASISCALGGVTSTAPCVATVS